VFILFVEDDQATRSSFARLLSARGHRVVTTADAESALAVLRSADKPELLLLDMVLEPGGMSGWDLAKAKSEDKDPEVREIPTVILSALDPGVIRGRGMRISNVLMDIQIIVSKTDPDGLVAAIHHIERLKKIALR
jgi:CheY-like chemotaxis protein